MSLNGSRDTGFYQNNIQISGLNDSMSKVNNSVTPNNTNLGKETPQSYKIREFEWFEVETKIRKFVNELLQPTIKKISIEKKQIDEVNEKIEKNNDQVRCLHDIIHYNSNKIKKIATTNSNVDVINNKNKQQEERINQFENHILSEYQHVKDQMKEVQQSKEKFQEDKNNLIEYFESFKKNTQEIITSLNKEITISSQQNKNEFSKIWESIYKTDHSTISNQQETQINNEKIKEIFEKLTTINIKNSSFEQSIEQANKAIETMQTNINIAKKFTNKVEDLQNKFKMVENYVQKYSCLYVQGQISETLFNVLDKSLKKKLVLYEDKAFSVMNQTILNDDGIPNLNQKIDDSINYLEKIIKRNAKYLQQKKNEQFEEEFQIPGIDTPQMINDKKDQIIFGFKDSIRKRSDQGDSQDDDNLIQNKIQNINININSKFSKQNTMQNQDESSNKHNNAVSNMGSNNCSTPANINEKSSFDNHPKIQTQQSKRSSVNSLTSNQKAEINQRQFGQLKLMIDMEIQKMKEIIDNKTQSLQNGLLENEEILQLNVQKIQDEMEKGINILKQQNNTVLLETGVLDKKITSIWNELEKIVSTFNILSETVHKIIHFNTLSNSLVLQDELDKQSIALYGFKTSFNDDPKANKNMRVSVLTGGNQIQSNTQTNIIKNKQNAISNLILDQNCLSCSGQTAQITQSFKMACLAYNPSTVNIDGRNYKREEVLEVATRLLQAARQQYGLKQNLNDFQDLSQMDSASNNDILDVSINRTDQQTPLEDVNPQIKSASYQKVNNTANSALDNVQTAVTQNSQTSFTHNGRFYINTQQSQQNNNNEQFRSNYANTSLNNSTIVNKAQSMLPQLEGLKPRSRAISKKSSTSNQSRLNSSQRREHTQN